MQRYIDELQLLHAIRLSVFAADLSGRLTFANDAAAELYGGSRDDLVGMQPDRLPHRPSLQGTEGGLGDVLAGRLWSGEVSVRKLGGAAFLARIVATPLVDAAGTTIGVVVVSEDITDLRLAEAEKAAGEQRLRLAHKAAGLGTWHWDIAAGTNIWDTRLEEIYGLPPGGFGGSFEAWMELLHPDDIPAVIDTVNAAMASPSSYLLKTRVIWPDDQTVHSIEAWGEVTTDDEGNPSGTIGCVRDVTDEVETQQALASALAAERQSAERTSLLLEVTADLSAAQTTTDVRQAVQFHLAEFGNAFGGRAELAVPDNMTEVRSGRDLVADGYDSLELADQTLLDGLAAQCRAAAERADLLARTSEIAEDLQVSLAASPLPHTDDVDIAVHYAAGGSELEHVGGDWYDAVTTRDGRLAVVVGDVMGRGVRAATTMIRVRAGLRGLITAEPAPENLLAFADDLLARDAPDQFVTAAAALLDPTAGQLRLCLAGHIPLVAVHPDGSTTLHGVDSGIPLGVEAGVVRRSETVATPQGTVLVLVTDGVVESRHEDLGEGIERLRARASELRDGPLDALVAGIAELADTSMRDDVTVLALRVR